MDYASSDPSVIRSIRQRYLLNIWQRAATKHRPLPLLVDFQPDRVADDLADMMGFDVTGQGEEARFLITQEGARLTATYGNEHVDPSQRTNRFLDDAIGPERYARVITLYRACLTHKRPTYSISMVQDADGKDVAYERLLLPFGHDSSVEQIVGSYKSISLEGGFKVSNLMGLQPKALPEIVLRAVIDREVATTAPHQTAGEVVELD